MNCPKFSIMCCAYNSSKTIHYTINSILNQTYDNYEVLIWDNNEHINEKETTKSLECLDTRIKIYDGCGHNIGWAHGTNELMKYASGDYMIMLAADDLLTDQYSLEKVAEEIKVYEPDIVFVGTHYTVFNEETPSFTVIGSYIPERKRLTDETDKITQFYFIMSNCYYNSMFHFCRLEFMIRNKLDFYEHTYADSETMTAAIGKASKISILDSPIHALTNNTSQTSKAVVIRDFGINQWKNIMEAVERKGIYNSEKLSFIAGRIMSNYLSCINNMLNPEVPKRNLDMNTICLSDMDIYNIVTKWLGNDYFWEMVYYAKCWDNVESFRENLVLLIEENNQSNNDYNCGIRKFDPVFQINRLLKLGEAVKLIEGRTDYLEIMKEIVEIIEKNISNFTKEDIEDIRDRMSCFM